MKTRIFLVAVLLVGVALVGCSKRKTQPTVATSNPAASSSSPAAPSPTPAPAPSATETAIELAPVYFPYDSDRLDAAAQSALEQAARRMRQTPALEVTIEGHCDERGTVEYNLALGQRRAESVRNYLVAAGVAETKLSTMSYGKERPFAEGSDESAWRENRRAHFTAR